MPELTTKDALLEKIAEQTTLMKENVKTTKDALLEKIAEQTTLMEENVQTTKDALLEKIAEQTTLMEENVKSVAPVGVVQAFAGSTTPDGWLLCDGSAVSRTDYAALFAVIGTKYGAGNGSTTFNLPNLVNKFVQGSDTSGTEKTAGLPNITGVFTLRKAGAGGHIVGYLDGPFSLTDTTISFSSLTYYQDSTADKINFDASRSNSIYGKSTTVQPPALTMRYIIKY